MSKLRPGWLALTASLFFAIALSYASFRAYADDAPNVLIILSDDQGWSDYGFMGHSQIKTPHLDRLAHQSLTFTRGYVPSSLCSPSLASIITGLYPHQHRVLGNDPARRDLAGKTYSDTEYRHRREALIATIDYVETLPRVLGRHGYQSLQTGKWWLGNYQRGGFSHGMTGGFPETSGRHGDKGLQIGREGVQPIADFVKKSVAAKQRFLVWYAPMMPHAPHNPPARLLNKYLSTTDSEPIARYWAMCEWFDETCGQVLDILDRSGVRDNTIVVYAADNGWINRLDRSAQAQRSKRSPYDGGLRTPIIVSWPNHLAPQRNDQTPVSSMDLAPTILSACGISPSPDLPGVNLLDSAAVASRSHLFGEIFAHDVAELDTPETSLLYRWTVSGRWKLIVPYSPNVSSNEPQLYDVLKDPHELHNLSADHAAIVAQLTSKIDEWWSPASSAK